MTASEAAVANAKKNVLPLRDLSVSHLSTSYMGCQAFLAGEAGVLSGDRFRVFDGGGTGVCWSPESHKEYRLSQPLHVQPTY